MDEVVHVDTPESVDLSLEPAGLGSRFLAAWIDGLVQAALSVLLLIGTVTYIAPSDSRSLQDRLANDLIYAILLLVLAIILLGIYKLLMEAVWNGQTVGKRMVGIRVVREDGLPAPLMSLTIRNLMRAVDYLPFGYLVGSVAILTNRHGQRLGDLAAGTIVVRERAVDLPGFPTALSRSPHADLDRLREHALRLAESDLEVARRFWARRRELEPQSRRRVGRLVAERLAGRMGWEDPLPPDPEFLIEETIYVRGR